MMDSCILSECYINIRSYTWGIPVYIGSDERHITIIIIITIIVILIIMLISKEIPNGKIVIFCNDRH